MTEHSSNQIIELVLRGDHITLAQAIKAVGLASSGAQAKHLVRGGTVKVNDAVDLQPGRKLVAGDRFSVGGRECVIRR